MATLTGARAGHTNGELATPTGARAGHTNGWHGPQAGSRLRLGWQALVDCRFRTTWDLGGAAVVNFWAGKLCFLSLNVVFFLCVFLWLVVLFVVLIFVVKSSRKLCTFCALFAWEVVLLIFSTFSKSTAESTKKTQHQARVFP